MFARIVGLCRGQRSRLTTSCPRALAAFPILAVPLKSSKTFISFQLDIILDQSHHMNVGDVCLSSNISSWLAAEAPHLNRDGAPVLFYLDKRVMEACNVARIGIAQRFYIKDHLGVVSGES